MSKKDLPTLDRYIATLGDSVVATQEIFDAAHREALAAFLPTAATLKGLDPASADALLAALAPPHQQLSEMTCRARVDLTADRSLGLALTVNPLGVGFARRFATSTQTASTMEVTVRPLVIKSPKEERHAQQQDQ